MNYYNENDPKAAAWLRELIVAGQIPDGKIDERSITDVQPNDLNGFTQCHFFAGIAGWPYALALAGWPEDRPVWTGSCPCQPLSCAGKRAGEKDERHLWPEFYRLISECRPSTIFGEQVDSPDGRGWLDGISLDLEELDYAIGASDLPAAGVGAPHIRQRLWWVANSYRKGLPNAQGGAGPARENGWPVAPSVALNDGTFRRLPEPGFRTVVDGVSAIPFAVRGYGNAIVPQVAAEFIRAYLETLTA